MKTKVMFKVLAVSMVTCGITAFILVSSLVADNLGTGNLHKLLHFIPTWIIRFVGAMQVLTYLPIFILGIRTLGTDGAIGKADRLRTWSVYRYLRNPMYAGLSFTVFGVGCLFGLTGVAAAGLIWLVICFFTSLLEERELTRRFGEAYIDYKISTPRFVPEFEILLRDIRKKIFITKET